VISIETARNELQHPSRMSINELIAESAVLMAIAALTVFFIF